MTSLMQSALKKIKQLPEKKQEIFAYIILEELDSEDIWEQKFSSTSEEKFKRLTEYARKEESIPLNEFLRTA